MGTFSYKGKEYKIDDGGFLEKFEEWSEDFAEAIAPEVGIKHGLTKAHWDVIYFIRDSFKEVGKCPLVYQTCRMNNFRLKELQSLFPAGYLRGACKLAGITYKEGYVKHSWLTATMRDAIAMATEKNYQVDARGFLVDAADWDEQFAVFKTHELKMPQLTEKHWKVINYMRNYYHQYKRVPTIFETGEANELEIEELAELFPDGYHRGAVKIAGLRVR